MMKAMNKFQELPIALPDADSIFFKFQGNPGAMKEAQEMVKEIAAKYGGKEMVFAKDAEEAKMLWAARKNAHWTLLNLIEGGKAYSTGKLEVGFIDDSRLDGSCASQMSVCRYQSCHNWRKTRRTISLNTESLVRSLGKHVSFSF